MEETAGKLATEKGHAEKVRRYGERLTRDHQAADKNVTGLAKREGILLVQPKPKPETEEEKEQAEHQKRAMERLHELTGDEFDRAFLKLMEEGHGQKVQMLKTALPKLKNPRVHGLVEKLIPILQEHRDLANHLHSGAFDAIQAGKLIWDQWAKHRAFCFWCLLAAGATFASVPLVLGEARAAFRNLRDRARRPAPAAGSWLARSMTQELPS